MAAIYLVWRSFHGKQQRVPSELPQKVGSQRFELIRGTLSADGTGEFAGVIKKLKIMATAFDAAAYILDKKGQMTAMKLQKLLYYAQAWSLVWDEKPLFPNIIQAWANGPVVPAVYNHHRGRYFVSREDFLSGCPESLDAEQRATIDAVLGHYGDRTSQWLIDLTHAEDPWKQARIGLGPGERGNREITHDSMADYYSGLT